MKGTGKTLLVVIPLACLIATAVAMAAFGGLTQKPGTAGCISETGTAGACVDGVALDGADGITISPDGRNAYVVSSNSEAVAIFDRDPATGALTQKEGTAGCISRTGTGGACVVGEGIRGARTVAISADGLSVYTASDISDAVAVFDRNPATGVLTQKAGTAGCISETGSGAACVDGKALLNPISVTISPGGANVYVASAVSDAVAIFDRNTTTGVLTQKTLTAGCISDTGSGGTCVNGVALDGAFSVAASPDANSVYVAAATSDAVAIFDRNPSTGVLTQKAGTAGCISETGTGGTCADGVALDVPRTLTVSADNTSVYVAAEVSAAVAILDRSTASGTLSQTPGTAGCISETGSGGACADGVALSGTWSVVASPDSRSVYAATSNSDAVAIFDRSPGNGTLNQQPGTAGCISETGSAGTCVDGTALVGAIAVAVAPDNAGVYVGSNESDAVVAFDRELPAAVPDLPDTVAPVTEITRQPKKRTKTKKRAKKIKVSFSSEAGATFECRLDRKPFKPCSSPFRARAKSKPGKGRKHTIEIRAIDAAGNVESTPAKAKFRLIRQR